MKVRLEMLSWRHMLEQKTLKLHTKDSHRVGFYLVQGQFRTAKLFTFRSFDNALDELKKFGNETPLRSVVVEKMGPKKAPKIYSGVGVSSFKEYANLAEIKGIVVNIGERIALAGSGW